MEDSKLEKIILPNRDGADLYLVQIEEDSNLYNIVCDLKHEYVLNYARMILAEDNLTIEAFDPSGGPYIYLGYKVDEKRKVKAIIPIGINVLFLIGT